MRHERCPAEMQIAQRYCRGGVCEHFDPVAVPVVIHRRDLERLAPLWLQYTRDIRRDRCVLAAAAASRCTMSWLIHRMSCQVCASRQPEVSRPHLCARSKAGRWEEINQPGVVQITCEQ